MINQNIKEIQSKLSDLKENKARNEATIEGIENRKKDLLYSVKSELNIDNENSILSQSDLNNISPENLPSLEEQTQKTEKIKIKVNSNVAIYILNSKFKQLKDIEERRNVKIIFENDNNIFPPNFEIEVLKDGIKNLQENNSENSKGQGREKNRTKKGVEP